MGTEHRRGATLSELEPEAEPQCETVDVQVEEDYIGKPHSHKDRRGRGGLWIEDFSRDQHREPLKKKTVREADAPLLRGPASACSVEASGV